MKYIISASLLAMSLSSFAADLSCEITPILADKGGYVMTGDTFTIKAPIQKDFNVDMSKCSKVKKSESLIMCAGESEIEGGFSTAIIIGEGEDASMSSSMFGTSKKNRKQLIKLTADYSILGNVKQRLYDAGIDFPQAWDGGDSLQIDDMVQEGMKKKVLVPNEVIIYAVGDCKVI